MNLGTALNTPFVQVALPIIVAFAIAAIFQNKRFDDLNKRFDDMNRRIDDIVQRLGRIETLLQNHDQRITRLA